jgi:hypothetical protein
LPKYIRCCWNWNIKYKIKPRERKSHPMGLAFLTTEKKERDLKLEHPKSKFKLNL